MAETETCTRSRLDSSPNKLGFGGLYRKRLDGICVPSFARWVIEFGIEPCKRRSSPNYLSRLTLTRMTTTSDCQRSLVRSTLVMPMVSGHMSAGSCMIIVAAPSIFPAHRSSTLVGARLNGFLHAHTSQIPPGQVATIRRLLLGSNATSVWATVVSLPLYDNRTLYRSCEMFSKLPKLSRA